MAAIDYFNAMQGVSERKDAAALQDVHIQQQRFDNILQNFAQRRQQQQQFDARQSLAVKDMSMREKAMGLEYQLGQAKLDQAGMVIDMQKQGIAAQNEAALLSKGLLDAVQTNDPDAVTQTTQSLAAQASSMAARNLIVDAGDKAASAIRNTNAAKEIGQVQEAKRLDSMSDLKYAMENSLYPDTASPQQILSDPELSVRVKRNQTSKVVDQWNSINPKAPLTLDDFFIKGSDGVPRFDSSRFSQVSSDLGRLQKQIDTTSDAYAKGVGTVESGYLTAKTSRGGLPTAVGTQLNTLLRTIGSASTPPDQMDAAKAQYNAFAMQYPGIPALPTVDPELSSSIKKINAAILDPALTKKTGTDFSLGGIGLDSGVEDILPYLNDAFAEGGKPKSEIESLLEKFKSDRGSRSSILKEAKGILSQKVATPFAQTAQVINPPDAVGQGDTMFDAKRAFTTKLIETPVGQPMTWNGKRGRVVESNGQKTWAPEQ